MRFYKVHISPKMLHLRTILASQLRTVSLRVVFAREVVMEALVVTLAEADICSPVPGTGWTFSSNVACCLPFHTCPG